MLSLSGSCIPLKVSLTVLKKVFLFFRVIIEYREYDRYMSFLGDLDRTFNLFKWILRGQTNDSSNSWAMPAFSHPLAMW